MSTLTLTRRTFAAAAATWAASAVRPAVAAPGRYSLSTDVWTGSVLLDEDMRSFVLGDLQQPVTLLKLWASWCPVCVAELPELVAMKSALGPNLGIILVSHPQYWPADRSFALRKELPFRVATFSSSNPPQITEQALLEPNGEYQVPKSLVFRKRDRSIVMKHDGSTNWASAAVLDQVEGLIRHG